jgi:hypothetical protein
MLEKGERRVLPTINAQLKYSLAQSQPCLLDKSLYYQPSPTYSSSQSYPVLPRTPSPVQTCPVLTIFLPVPPSPAYYFVHQSYPLLPSQNQFCLLNPIQSSYLNTMLPWGFSGLYKKPQFPLYSKLRDLVTICIQLRK